MPRRTFEEVAQYAYASTDLYQELPKKPNIDEQVEFLRAARRNGYKLAAHEEALLARESERKVRRAAPRDNFEEDDNLYNELDEDETKIKDSTMPRIPKIGTIFTQSNNPSYSDYDIVTNHRNSSTMYPIQGLKDMYELSDLQTITIENRVVDIKIATDSNIEVRVGSLDLTIPIGLEDIPIKRTSKKSFDMMMKEVIKEATIEIRKYKKEIEDKTTRQLELEKLATTYKPIANTIIVEEDYDNFAIEVPEDLSIQDKYTTVVGNINEIVANINDSNSLDSQKELAEAFLKVRSELSKFTNKEPSKMSTLAVKYLGKSNWLSKKISNAKDTIAENASVKSNIDYIFGLMHEKYNKLVEVAEGLQKSKATLQGQLEALTALATESDAHLATFDDPSEAPMRELGLNTQIKASVEKYRDRIAKVKGAVTAMQATVIALGRDLPAHKSDLEDEMALSGLLTNIDDYQKMFGEVKNLVVEVTASTREQTHEVVDSLMKMQIEDTHTMEAIANNIESGKQFTKMLAENTQKLADKTVRDAQFISKVASGVPIENVRKEVKKLKVNQ